MCSKIGRRLLQAVLFAQQEDYFSWDKQFKRIWVYLHVSGRAWHDRPWIFMIRWHHNETSCWTSSPVAGELFTSSLRAEKDRAEDSHDLTFMSQYHWLFIIDLMQVCKYTCSFPTSIRIISLTWWRHQMETFSALLALCAGNSPVTGEFPTQRPVTRSFDAFFDRRPNKRLNKHWWGCWFETPSRPLWRHCNV